MTNQTPLLHPRELTLDELDHVSGGSRLRGRRFNNDNTASDRDIEEITVTARRPPGPAPTFVEYSSFFAPRTTIQYGNRLGAAVTANGIIIESEVTTEKNVGTSRTFIDTDGNLEADDGRQIRNAYSNFLREYFGPEVNIFPER